MSKTYNENLNEAKRLRNLGYYNQAATFFHAAEEQEPDLGLSTEITGLLMEQGYGKNAYDRISAAMENLTGDEEREDVAVAEIVHAFATTFSTGLFKVPLETAGKIYSEWLKDAEPSSYTKKMFMMEGTYNHLQDLATTVGHDTKAPRTSLEKFKALFNYAIEKEWYPNARRIAAMYAGPTPGVMDWSGGSPRNHNRIELLDILLSNPALPELLRAETLISIAEILREGDDQKRSIALELKAKKIFNKVGHANGANLVDLEHLKRPLPSSKNTVEARIRALRELKPKFEAVDNLTGVSEVVRAMYSIAQKAQIYDLMTSLNEEINMVKELTGTKLVWCSWQSYVFDTFQFPGGHSGKLLASLEYFYESLATMEIPRTTELVALKIAKAYENVGRFEEAKIWRAKAVNKYSKLEQMEHDPFLVALIATKVSSGPEEEESKLDEALIRFAEEADEPVAIAERFVAVMKISNIGDHYLNQAAIRGMELTKKLVGKCIVHGRGLLKNLAKDQALLYESNFLKLEARLLFTEGCLAGPTPDLGLLDQSVVVNKKLIKHCQAHSLDQQTGYAIFQLAICQQQIWSASGFSSQRFWDSLQSYDAALRIFEAQRHINTLKMVTMFACKALFIGYVRKIQPRIGPFRRIFLRIASWFRYKPPNPILLKSAEYRKKLEVLADAQRHDLSSLGTEQAMLAKQNLQDTSDTRTLFEQGVSIYASENDMTSVWDIIQKSKARSVSDLLGLGVNIPQWLQSRIDTNENAKALLVEETRLTKMVEGITSMEKFQFQIKLENHRKEMRKVDCLREVLELREGHPVTMERLRAATSIQKSAVKERQTYFVDYLINSGKVFGLVLTPNGIQTFDAKSTVEELQAWKVENIDEADGEPLNSSDMMPLQELSKLVSPLLDMTKEGDLLVICGSEILNYIPLHALTISPDSETSLIERNPIVYCPSMTVFEQCISRSNSRTIPNEAGQSILAVYEKPGFSEEWRDSRDRSYDLCKELAGEMESCKFYFGVGVDKERFRNECEESKIIHFFGHGRTEDGILTQHLEICSSSKPQDVEPEINKEESSEGNQDLVALDAYTISDIFKTPIHASHFNLVACASASQLIKKGDEPWGIVTALLCAGATSVGGTMWDVQVGTGRRFMEIMYLRGRGEGDVVDLAVALQETVKKMKGDMRTCEPYHWAPFVLHGAWFYR